MVKAKADAKRPIDPKIPLESMVIKQTYEYVCFTQGHYVMAVLAVQGGRSNRAFVAAGQCRMQYIFPAAFTYAFGVGRVYLFQAIPNLILGIAQKI